MCIRDSMAAFINNDITAAGLLVLAKGVAGQQINYTKIVLGDGYLCLLYTSSSTTGARTWASPPSRSARP